MEKRAMILDGATESGVDTRRAGDVAMDVFRRGGWRVDRLALREVDIAPCLGCFGCWIQTPGLCVIDDAGRDVARRMAQSDVLVYLTPLTFGGYSSELKKAIDRSIPNLSPLFRTVRHEVHHVKRYARYPRLVGIAVSRDRPIDPDEEELFEAVVRRNAINFYAPANAACLVPDGGDDEACRRTIERTLERVIGP